MGQHHEAQDQDGIHGPVLEIDIFPDLLHIVNRELPDDDGPDSVPQKNQGHRESKGKGPHDAVDRKGGINHFQIEDLGDFG